ncbi:MAG TPA: FAD-dependent oxidoreductase [Clostridia bacterium]|nr:FAD-dependent oxidoreductase [Clostridia bacterium]
MESIWVKLEESKSEGLSRDIERDIVVVGGGIAGYLTAYRLAESGQNVTLIEAKTLFSGVTHSTTAHIETLLGYTFTSIKKRSEKAAELYFRSQMEAIDEYENLVRKYKIDCDFKRLDGYIYTSNENEKLKEEYNTLKDFGADVEYIETQSMLGFNTTAALKLSNQAIFEPIKFLQGLPCNFEVFENTKVIDVDFNDHILYTKNGTITAQKIIIATNFPLMNFQGWYFLRMYKSHSYAVAIDKAKDINGVYQSDAENGITFRNQNNYLIVGGLDHRSGRIDKTDKFERLFELGKHLTDGGECVRTWAANDCITFDELPYIGYYSKKSNDIFVITGFNKLGMTKAMAASLLITDMINGVDNEYEHLYSPQRPTAGFFAFIKNLGCTVKNLVIMPLLPVFRTYKSLQKGEGDIVYYKCRKRAVYRDENGELHTCKPRCAHLGCQLKFNNETKTWDCPCHGSCFDVDGNIITAPTVKNLERIN